MTNDTVLENTLFLSMNMTNRCYLGNNNPIHLFSAKIGKLKLFTRKKALFCDFKCIIKARAYIKYYVSSNGP